VDRIFESLERLKALWIELERVPAGTPKYETLMTQIRVESDAYKALIDAEKRPSLRRQKA
jgi:hypothetical protein